MTLTDIPQQRTESPTEATTARRAGSYRIAGAAVAGAAIGAGVALAFTAGAGPADRYLDGLADRGLRPAEGHQPYIVAAGYRVCGDLAGGASRDQVVAAGIRDGIGGDLFTAASVRAIVDEATRTLC